jgi:nicotinamidase-related amidase
MSQTITQMTKANLSPSPLDQSALVIIDAQNEYVFGKLALSGMDKAIEETLRLIRLARSREMPVIHIVQASAPDRPLFTPGTPLAEIIPALTPLTGEVVIAKRNSNAFGGTNLAEMFHETGRREMILAGFMTHNCITATARSAEDHGIRTTVVAAATATRDLPDALTGKTIPAELVQASALASLADRTSIVVKDASYLI